MRIVGTTLVIVSLLIVGIAYAQDSKDQNATAHSHTEASKQFIVVVNGVGISREVFDQEVVALEKRFSTFGGDLPPDQMERFKRKIHDSLIEDELVRQRMSSADITVSDAEVEAEIEKFKSKTPGGPDQFESFLGKSGKTLEDLRKDVHQRLSLRRYLLKQGYMTLPTAANVQSYYVENQARFEVKARVKASHILVKVKADDDGATQREVRRSIDRIYRKAIARNADFAQLAREHSEGPSAARGGDLGWFGRGRMVKEFEDVAFRLKVGAVSRPVKTKFGWHIIKVLEREQAHTEPLEEVQDDISKRLEARSFRAGRDKLMTELRDKATIVSYEYPE